MIDMKGNVSEGYVCHEVFDIEVAKLVLILVMTVIQRCNFNNALQLEL